MFALTAQKLFCDCQNLLAAGDRFFQESHVAGGLESFVISKCPSDAAEEEHWQMFPSRICSERVVEFETIWPRSVAVLREQVDGRASENLQGLVVVGGLHVFAPSFPKHLAKHIEHTVVIIHAQNFNHNHWPQITI